MASTQRSESREEPLNDSWVELNLQQQGSANNSGQSTPHPVTALNGQMDKMLLEALREASKQSSKQSSVIPSNASSRNSPKSPHSPNTEWATDISTKQGASGFQSSDWIWDWSSRPEQQPPSDLNGRFKHPSAKRHKLSMRNSSVMKSPLFSLENLPTLLLTHACTFFLGAAAMFVFVKKYCGWSTTAPAAFD